ncbi:hypothetical protein V1514DRAFT_338134 [Lipomyces japonicus]|uniref:uncharacterized protein n=1 Tax=Lipomyces japonicus TaxID=56871 RepID=UPI0034CFB6CA
MAPATSTSFDSLQKRQVWGSYNCRYYGNCSGWGRWLLLGIIVVVALLLFWLFVLPPAYGTQWMGATSGYSGPAQQQQPQQTGTGQYYAGAYTNQTQYQAPPPAYVNSSNSDGPQTQGTYYYAQNGNQYQQNQSDAYEMTDYSPPNHPPPTHAK